MPDQPMTSRDLIRAAIREHEDPWTVVPQPDALAERIDRALFGTAGEDGAVVVTSTRYQELIAAGQPLTDLEAEVRRLLTVLEPVDFEWGGGVRETLPARLARRQEMAYAAIADYPVIAALLSEEGDRV